MEALLDGSVRKADDRLRVTVELVEVRTGYHLWSQRFDSTLDDVFAIQDQIAETVATQLRGGVSADGRSGDCCGRTPAWRRTSITCVHASTCRG